MLLKRNYPKIKYFLDRAKSVMIFGPRGTGKTFFLTKLVKSYPNHVIYNLLDQNIYFRYLNQPGQIYIEVEDRINNYEGKDLLYVLIDEVQLLPALLNEVQRLMTDFKDRVVFILTGSSARKLKRDNANLLAGRAISLSFFSLSIDEIDVTKNLNKILRFGLLPDSYLEKDLILKTEYLKTYLGTYLQQEIQRESEVRNLQSFSQFLELAAIENGKLVNYSKIAKEIGLSGPTVKEYYQILEDTLIACKIPAWTHSVRKQIMQSPKYYLFDTGLVNALAGGLQEELKSKTYKYGNLFETLVVLEIVKYFSVRGSEFKMYHYRDYDGLEVDLVLQRGRFEDPIAIEIKSGESPDEDKARSLIKFKEQFPNAKCMLFCRTPYAYEKSGVRFLPFLEGIHSLQ